MLNIDEPIFPRALSDAPLQRDPSCLVPARMPIVGRHVVLEPLDPDRHTADLYAAFHEDEAARRVWTWLGVGPFANQGAFRAELTARAAAFDPVFYALRPAGGGRAEGMASFMEIFPKVGAIEIGHLCFSPRLQRSRAATEALSMMMAYALDPREVGGLGYRRLQWKCHAMNMPSRSAARRLGFRHEGILFHATVHKGANRDTAFYSLLDHEWPHLRAAHLNWLADDNFGPDGRARRSLAEMTAAIAQADAARLRR
ncbi:MAG: GNAT family N-acetyltransferase [Alphaproteobacteria bacterium]|nr:GNAT family N-acetyltransferase [Alphaproteobacteria bacterium]